MKVTKNVENLHSQEINRLRRLEDVCIDHRRLDVGVKKPKFAQELSQTPRCENMNKLDDLLEEIFKEEDEKNPETTTKLEGKYSGKKDDPRNRWIEVLL